MINLNDIVSPVLDGAGVHPLQPAKLYRFKGNINDRGRVKSVYFAPVDVDIQIQSAGEAALNHRARDNDNTIERNIWISEKISGLDRVLAKAGDMLFFSDKWWLVTALPYDFTPAGWICARVTMQIKAPESIEAEG